MSHRMDSSRSPFLPTKVGNLRLAHSFRNSGNGSNSHMSTVLRISMVDSIAIPDRMTFSKPASLHVFCRSFFVMVWKCTYCATAWTTASGLPILWTGKPLASQARNRSRISSWASNWSHWEDLSPILASASLRTPRRTHSSRIAGMGKAPQIVTFRSASRNSSACKSLSLGSPVLWYHATKSSKPICWICSNCVATVAASKVPKCWTGMSKPR
mmetsp:Transcript_155063/g.497123  ORF Transcript_155063/g.497123 Transcript_155063/m.497123 type:complete len:213 (+) Transcript_155063:4199-4837(+)